MSNCAVHEHAQEPDRQLVTARQTSRHETIRTMIPPRGANAAGWAAVALSLQRCVGNRAAAAVLAPAQIPARTLLQRHPRACDCPPVNEGATEFPIQRMTAVQREPTLTMVNHGSGLTYKELKTVKKEAQQALDDTTRHAKDPALKKKGVTIRFQSSLQDVEGLRKKGVILVYLVHDIKNDTKREGVVREILTAEGALKGSRLDEIVKRVTGDLGQSQHVRDRASNVAFINLDLISGRGVDSLRAIAGDVLHEGIGHRAIPPPKGESTYHNPQDKGVMSKGIREKAKKVDILFRGDERDKVNDFLKSIVDNPEWNKD